MPRLIGLKMHGIRSIGDDPHIINFLHPLTIIQGPNGTGKTTTIEALNYITTGALPSGKMLAFIHNLQLVNAPKVDAMVQLEFVDVKGRICTATKRCNASAGGRGGKLSTKSDEYTLKIHDKFGNVKTISSKVNDFNKEILNLLGVPKAILEYVLFCHQEDSNWPLSEPKELKCRFDAIFEVTKYVKALDCIKRSIKEMNVQLQIIDKELPHLEANCRIRVELKMKYDDCINTLKTNRELIENLKQDKESLDNELTETRRNVELAFKLNHDTEVFEGQIRIHRRFLDGITVQDFIGTRSELEDALKTTRQLSQVESSQGRRHEIALNIQTIMTKLSHCHEIEESLKDKIVQEKTHRTIRKRQEDEYKTLLVEAHLKYNIPENKDIIKALAEFLEELSDDSLIFESSQSTQKQSFEKEMDLLRIKIAELKSVNKFKAPEMAKLSQAIALANREIQKSGNTEQNVNFLHKEITKYEKQLSNLGGFDLLDTIWQNLQNIQTTLNRLRMDFMELSGSKTFDDSDQAKMTRVITEAEEKVGTSLEQINQLKERVRINSQLIEFKDRLSTTGEKSLQQDVLKQSVSEKRERLAELQNAISAATLELPSVEKQLTQIEKEYNELTTSLIENKKKTAGDTEIIKQIIHRIKELKQSISKSDHQSDDLDVLNEKVSEIRSEVDSLNKQRTILERQLNGFETKKNEVHILEDQLKKIDTLTELEGLQRELNAFKTKAIADGLGDLVDLRRKEARLNAKSLEMNNQIQQKTGEQLQLRKKVDELRRQLDDLHVADAKKIYARKIIDRGIISSSIEDKEKYYKAMDDSIISFHQQKMEQINEILQELWQRVYQGNDIETIKIKSQPITGGEKKRSYDYSVVMTVDQRDIDMRDRCSAGQKVLASILIRIALADVFAGNCPILALDEPTTNLDVNKVENVGAMLKSLIDLRNQPPTQGGGAIGLTRLHDFDENFNDEFESASQQQPMEDDTDQEGTSASTSSNPRRPSLSSMNMGTVSQAAGGIDTTSRSLQLIVITHDKHLVDNLYQACRPEYIYVLNKDEYGVSHCRQYNYNNDLCEY